MFDIDLLGLAGRQAARHVWGERRLDWAVTAAAQLGIKTNLVQSGLVRAKHSAPI